MPDFAEQLVMAEEAGPVEPVAAPTPEPAPADASQPRNPDGTFAAKVKDEGNETGVKPEAATPQQAAQPTPEPPAGDEGKHVPLEALKALKQKLAETEARVAELSRPKPAEQAQPTPQPHPPNPSQSETPKGPDFSFDESDYQDNPQGLFEARIHKNKMDMSTLVAGQQFGEAAVNEAWNAFEQACANDPKVRMWSFSPELRNHVHPIGQVVQWHRQQQEIGQLTQAGGIDKLRESIRAQLMAELGGAQPQAQPAQAVAPAAVAMPKPAAPATPPSLARGGAGVNSAPERLTDNDVFENIFDKSKRLSRSKR